MMPRISRSFNGCASSTPKEVSIQISFLKLLLAGAISKVNFLMKGNLLGLETPCVRQYGIWG